ncbi:MAG: glycoside hydrolase family 26 protein [Myxococcota bacterium]
MVGLKRSALKRTSVVAVGIGSAMAASLALARCGSAAAGPLSDLESLSRDVVQGLTSSQLSEEHRAGRRKRLTSFMAARTNRKELERQSLIGTYEPPGRDYWARVERSERALGVDFHLLHVFVGWTPRRAGKFPTEHVEAIWDAGSLPVITWEPWTDAFESNVQVPRERPLQRIAQGQYDAYIDAFAREAARFAQPFFLRFAHEMNDAYRYPWGPQYGNQPEHYQRAFRHVRARFEAQGARNAIWVWAPSVSYSNINEYYPGKDWVDWVATGVLNYGSTMRWSAWWSVQELLGPRYETLAAFGHPLMIAEFGTVREGGSAAAWYRDATTSLETSFSDVRAIVLFHDSQDATLEHRVVDFSATSEAGVNGAASETLRRFSARGVRSDDTR